MKSIHHGDPELAEFRVFSLKNFISALRASAVQSPNLASHEDL